MDYLGQGQSEPNHNPEWHYYDPDAQQQEQHRRESQQELFEVIRQMQQDSLRAARLNLAATIIFGIIVVILAIMQLRLSTKPTPTVTQQPNSQQNIEVLPSGVIDQLPDDLTSGTH
jgi:hypothetical protein